MAKSVMKPRRKGKLPQAPALEKKHKRTLVVVADGSRARFLETSDDHRKLVPALHGAMTAAEARRPTRDLVTDKPGRRFSSSGGNVRHAVEPAHDVHKMAKHDFTARVADVLDKACAGKEFDRLVLVAPRRSLGELRTLLSARVKKTVTHEVAKDLTNSTPAAVRKALVGALPEAAIAA